MLHCQIATTSDLALLRNSISRPNESIAVYKILQYPYETSLCSTLKGKYGDLEALSKTFRNSRQAASLLGEWCADTIWRLALEEEQSTRKAERKMERIFNRDQENKPIQLLDKELIRLKEVRDIVREWRYAPLSFEGNSLSPKVVLLHKYLNLIYGKSTDAKCIIFVKQRYTARLLGKVFERIGSDHMRLDLLIGNKSGELGDLKFSFRQQVMTLLKFRKGELNCLIATSIAEEGLDIPDCNLVIRFDLYDTLIQYIQSRGRARHANSKYIHMVEEANRTHFQAVQDVRMGEQVMRQFCVALPADRLLQGEDYNLETALMQDKAYEKYVEPETGATLTYATSLVVLANFVGCLVGLLTLLEENSTDLIQPHNSETINQATYTISVDNRKFICEVILPEHSPLHSATGKPCSRKSLARRSAAFEACVILRQKKYLDSNLIPTYHKYLPQMRNAHLALNSKKSNAYTMKTKPSLWEKTRGSRPDRLYATVIELESPGNLGRDCRPLVILTRTRLPDFPAFILHVQVDKTSNVLCTSISEDFEVNPVKLSGLTDFTLRIYKDIYNKTFEKYEPGMTYWLAPVTEIWRRDSRQQTPEQIIDWDLVTYIQNNKEIPWSINTPLNSLVNRYLIDRWDGGRRFFSVAIEPDLHPRDPVPKDASSHKYMNTILDYSVSLFSKSRARAKWRLDQPVIRAERILHRLNLLDQHSDKEKTVNTRSYLCPEPLKWSAVSTHVTKSSLY